MKKWRNAWILPLCLLLAVGLSACAPAGGDTPHPEAKEGVLTYAALNPLSEELERRIRSFNTNHPDVQIEVVDYSDEGGIERLMTELALGWVPDIMELHRLGSRGEKRPHFHIMDIRLEEKIGGIHPSEGEYWMPYRQMARKGYLEDLWPYIESDPKLGRDALLETPMKAAEVDGGLYILFREVYISTLAGAESVVGDRDGWTLEELMETFSSMPEGSTILRYYATRWEVYSKLFATTLDQYIDWEAGQCSFDNDEFRTMVGFLSAFPAEFKTALTSQEIWKEAAWRRLEGEQMLEPVVVSYLEDLSTFDIIFGEERVSFVGCPTANGSSGSLFGICGNVLAMSSACSDKEAAWEFMGYLVRAAYSVRQMDDMTFWSEVCKIALPVNRKSYENGITADLNRDTKYYTYDRPVFPGGPRFPRKPLTQEDHRQRYERLVNSTTQLYWPDDALSDIVWETLGAYFAGDRTLDDTIGLLNNRVGVYLNEQK